MSDPRLVETIEATLYEHNRGDNFAGDCDCGFLFDGLAEHDRHVAEAVAEAIGLDQVGWRSTRRFYDIDQLALPEQMYARSCVPVFRVACLGGTPDDEDELEDAHGYTRSDLLFGGNW